MAAQKGRLDHSVVPSNYKIRIETDLKSFKFRGTETIRINIAKRTRAITLNCSDPKVISAEIASKGKLQAAKLGYDKKYGLLRLTFGKTVSGKAELNIVFEGVNNDKLYGFYRSVYKRNGKNFYLLTTQFESPDARAAFPCFDQPDLKATFDLTLVVDRKLDAISNMPIKSAVIKGNRKAVTFRTTPIMSTYLLYMGVGEFEYKSTTYRNIKIRAVAVPGNSEYMSMPLKFTVQFLSHFEKYFGIKYPLPKMDIIAVPDFAVGAMENWGAITFRETEMLGSWGKTSMATIQRIATVVAHELSHQWFGNLVTMEWWNDLWLNESFAEMMGYKAPIAVYPEWKLDKQYYLDIIASALVADGVKSAHPINVEVDSPDEASSLVDAISYNKGGAVLNMLEDYMGEEKFRKGMHAYLKSNAYSNATKIDLWNSMAAQMKNDKFGIKRLIEYWIENSGYPIITVEQGYGSVKLTQEQFLLSGKPKKAVWPVPIHYLTSSGEEGSFVMSKKSHELKLGIFEWIKINHNQKGFYRVRYSGRLLITIGRAARSGELSVEDAWGIENDLFAMARCGMIPISDYMEFVENCTNYQFPMTFSIAGHLGWLRNMLYRTDKEEEVSKFARKYYARNLRRLGWEVRKGEDSISTMERPLFISGLSTLEDQEVVSRLTNMFNEYYSKGKKIDPNMDGVVFSSVAWNHNEKVRDKLLRLLAKAKRPDEQRKLLRALAMFSDPKLLAKSIDYSMSDKVRLQDDFLIPALVSMNKMGKQLMVEWTLKNWKAMMDKHPATIHMLDRFVQNFECIADEKSLARVRKLFSKKSNRRGDIEGPIRVTMEKIEANIAFMKANGLEK